MKVKLISDSYPQEVDMNDKQYIEFLKRHIESLNEIVRGYEEMFSSVDKATEVLQRNIKDLEVKND